DNGHNTRIPKVNLTLQGKDGYIHQTDNGLTSSLTLSIRVLYTTQSPNANVLQMQVASPTAAPGNTMKPNDDAVIKNVNVYLKYTGPSIVFDVA
ncbi:hemagglutinin, partial [Mycoplasmopsis synoviae]